MRFVITGIMHVYRIIIILSMMVTIILYCIHTMAKPAILKATMSEIRICDENNRLICRHPRSYKDFPRYITDVAHMPEHHQYYKRN